VGFLQSRMASAHVTLTASEQESAVEAVTLCGLRPPTEMMYAPAPPPARFEPPPCLTSEKNRAAASWTGSWRIDPRSLVTAPEPRHACSRAQLSRSQLKGATKHAQPPGLGFELTASWSSAPRLLSEGSATWRLVLAPARGTARPTLMFLMQVMLQLG